MNGNHSLGTSAAIANLFTILAVILVSSATSRATLVEFDTRAVRSGVLASDQGVGQTSATIDVTNPHFPTYLPGTLANSRLVFQLWAILNSQTSNPEGVQFTQGSIVSTNSTGDFLLPNAGRIRSTVDGALANNVPHFDASTSRSGNPVEASASYGGAADGILDIGDLSTNASVTSAPLQWFGADSGLNSFTLPAGETEVLLGEFALTVGEDAQIGSTSLGYFMRPRHAFPLVALERIQKFTVDGVVYSLNYQGVGSANNVAFADPDAFEVTDLTLGEAALPEPSAFCMVLLGSLGLIGFRRGKRGHRSP